MHVLAHPLHVIARQRLLDLAAGLGTQRFGVLAHTFGLVALKRLVQRRPRALKPLPHALTLELGLSLTRQLSRLLLP